MSHRRAASPAKKLKLKYHFKIPQWTKSLCAFSSNMHRDPKAGNQQPSANDVTVGKKVCAQYYLLFFVLKTVGLVLLYYVFSIGLTFYQKKFIKTFEFPLTIVTGHFLIKFILAAIVRGVWWCSSGSKRVSLSWGSYITRVGPAGIAAALDIGLSNWSLLFITISLYTMTKSSAIVFILFFALLLKLEKFKWTLIMVVGLISSGLFLFTFESTQFHAFGFLLVLAASALSGIRWTLSQCLTQRKDMGLSNPIDMIFHIQPWMFVTLLPLALVFEGKTVLDADSFNSREETVRTLLLVAGGGVAGFLMEVSEYILLTHTSSLTLSVSGISKEICQFVLAYAYNGDRFSPMNVAGLVICMSGVVLHVGVKLLEQRKLVTGEVEPAPPRGSLSKSKPGSKEGPAAALLAGDPEEWDDVSLEMKTTSA